MSGQREVSEGKHASAVLALLVFLACLVVYIPTVSKVVVNTDAEANSLAAWQLAQTGRPWMDGLDLRESGKVSHYGVGRDGHAVTTRTPGQIWAAAPFYLGSSPEQSEWTFVRGSVAAAVLTSGAVALLFLALVGLSAGRPLALGGAAVLAFATPLWSVSANALWTHPVTLLGLAGAALASARKRWWLVGAWLGVAMTARVHIALIASVMGLGLAWSLRSPRVAVRVAIPSLLALGVLSIWGKYVFGSWDPRGAYAGHSLDSMIPSVSQDSGYVVNLAGFLIAPDRGLFVWTPLLVVLLPVVAMSWRSAPAWTRWLALGGLVYALAQVGLNVFHGGDAFFGYRHALELLVAVTPLYVACAARAGRATRILASIAIGAQAGAFLLGSSIETLLLSESEVWRRNALVEALRGHPSDLGVSFLFISTVVALGTYAVVRPRRPGRTRLRHDETQFGRSTAPPSVAD